MNNNDELAKFGLHNGGDPDSSLLNEKWEGLAIVPVDGKNGDDDWWYVIAVNDNDFITQNGKFTCKKERKGFLEDLLILVLRNLQLWKGHLRRLIRQ